VDRPLRQDRRAHVRAMISVLEPLYHLRVLQSQCRWRLQAGAHSGGYRGRRGPDRYSGRHALQEARRRCVGAFDGVDARWWRSVARRYLQA
jgi:hypothetical protein